MIVVGVIGITTGRVLLGGRFLFLGNHTKMNTAIHISIARSIPTVIERPSTTGSVGGTVLVVVAVVGGVVEVEVVEVVVVIVGLAVVVVVDVVVVTLVV